MKTLILSILIISALSSANAQATKITYPGSLINAGTAANGSFDFEFLLYDAGGVQLGAPVSRSGVAVTNGIFAVPPGLLPRQRPRAWHRDTRL